MKRNMCKKSSGPFLQRNLGLWPVNDSFVVKNSDSLIHFLREKLSVGHWCFSTNIEGLHYSLLHDTLLIRVGGDNFGALPF